MKALDDKRVTLAVVALVIVAIGGALFAPLEAELKVELVGVIGVLGAALAGALRGVAPKLIPLGLALALSTALSGCGASALRTHAQTARTLMVAIDGAGVAIAEGTRVALDRCAAVETADARLSCIDGVERDAVAAAAARDALIAPVHAYRDATMHVRDESDAKPGLVGFLGVLALSIARDWPAFSEALAAFGLPVPEVDLPGVPQ